MNIPSKKKLPQIPLDIDFKDLMDLYKIYTAKPYSFLVIDTAFAFKIRENLLARM